MPQPIYPPQIPGKPPQSPYDAQYAPQPQSQTQIGYAGQYQQQGGYTGQFSNQQQYPTQNVNPYQASAPTVEYSTYTTNEATEATNFPQNY